MGVYYIFASARTCACLLVYEHRLDYSDVIFHVASLVHPRKMRKEKKQVFSHDRHSLIAVELGAYASRNLHMCLYVSVHQVVLVVASPYQGVRIRFSSVDG